MTFSGNLDVSRVLSLIALFGGVSEIGSRTYPHSFMARGIRVRPTRVANSGHPDSTMQ